MCHCVRQVKIKTDRKEIENKNKTKQNNGDATAEKTKSYVTRRAGRESQFGLKEADKCLEV